MGNVVGGLTNALFGKGGAGTMAGAVDRARAMAGDVRFNPYTVRTGAGQTSYTKDNGFGVMLSDPYQRLLETSQAGAQGLFEQVASFDPNQRASDIIAERAALLEPLFAQQRAKQTGSSFATGRLGMRLAGESLGAGEGSGMINPDFYGLNVAQSGALANLVPSAMSQAYGEYGQLLNMGQGLFGTAMGLTGLEKDLLMTGVGLEGTRAGQNLAAGQFELSPLLAQAKMQEDRRASNMGFVTGMAKALVPLA